MGDAISVRSAFRPRPSSSTEGARSARPSGSSFPATSWSRWQMSDAAWHVVKNTPKVTGFVGSGKNPDAADPGRGRPDSRAGGRVPRRSPSRSTSSRSCEPVKIIDGPSTTSPGWSTRSTSTGIHAQGHGDDLRATNAGRARLQPGAEAVACERLESGKDEHGKEESQDRSSCRFRQAGDAGAPRGARRWVRPGVNIMDFLQGVQRPDAGRQRASSFRS